MLIEQLFFSLVALILFVIVFIKMIQKNDTTYINILILEAIGITINFIEIVLATSFSLIIKILTYVFSILIPIIVIIFEKRKINITEIIKAGKAKVFLFFRSNKLAKNELISLVTKYPESYLGHKMLAEIYENEGGMRKAIDEYVQVIDINKNDYNSYFKIANLLNQLDKKDEATQMLNNLLTKKPDHYEATELLGNILIEQEMYKEAVAIYTEALKYNPTSYELNYSLGIAFTMLNDFQSAKLYYEKAAELNSLVYNSKYSLAEIALIYKELEEAEKYFIQVLEDKELEDDAYFELAKINIIKGEKEKAIQYANIAIEISPKKIVDKIKKDEIFMPIIAKLSIPFNIEEQEKETKMSTKEIKAKKHLEEMFEITRNLSYNDIRLLKRNKREENVNKQEQKEIEGWQKEK